jgi:hypothetical protein
MTGELRPKRSNSYNMTRLLWITVALLLFFLVLYLVFVVPQMFQLIETFAVHPITIIGVLLLLSILTRILLPKRLREFCFIPEAIIVASTIGLFLEVPHIESLYKPEEHYLDIAGDCEYTVKDAAGAITHGGDSTIRQGSGELFIDGHRLYSVPHGSTTPVPIPNGGTYWSTDFAGVYGTTVKQVHFVYTIRLPGENADSPAQIVRGYCVLTPEGNPIETLQGTYTHLAPGRLTGDIVFKRVVNKQQSRTVNRS